MADQARVATDPGGTVTTRPPLDLRRRPRIGEAIIQFILFACGLTSIFVTLGIVYVLGKESLLFFRDPTVSLVDFFTTTIWQPSIGKFGILPLVNATLMTSLIAMLVAIPLGLGAAIYLAEYASERARGILKPILELLAGVPTVVYGYFALTFVTPILRSVFGQDTVEIYNDLSAGIVVGILIIPIVATLSEDALSAGPQPCDKPPSDSVRQSLKLLSTLLSPRPSLASSPPGSSPCPAQWARRWWWLWQPVPVPTLPSTPSSLPKP